MSQEKRVRRAPRGVDDYFCVSVTHRQFALRQPEVPAFGTRDLVSLAGRTLLVAERFGGGFRHDV